MRVSLDVRRNILILIIETAHKKNIIKLYRYRFHEFFCSSLLPFSSSSLRTKPYLHTNKSYSFHFSTSFFRCWFKVVWSLIENKKTQTHFMSVEEERKIIFDLYIAKLYLYVIDDDHECYLVYFRNENKLFTRVWVGINLRLLDLCWVNVFTRWYYEELS